MTVSGLGTTRKGFRIPVLPIFSAVFLLGALFLFANELIKFAQGRDLFQTDITVAGIPVTGLSQEEAVRTWESIYSQPIELSYQGSPIILNPADIGFRPNSERMRDDIQSKVAGTNNYWVDFWNYLWRRPTSPVVVDLVADYQEAKLRNLLQDIAVRYERRASSASFDLDTMTFGSGSAGQLLDVESSIQAIDAALHRPTNRKVRLVMKGEGARTADMQTLKQGILDYLVAKGFSADGPDTLASVVILDLDSGREITINPEIAYSAMSTIKIPILINMFRKLPITPDQNIKWLMGASILCSSNSASNWLIQLSGQGDAVRSQLASGLEQVTQTAQSLGAKNTFISAPLYVGDPNFQFSIAAPKTSPDPAHTAKPDAYSQTTALDMAVMLQEIYSCSEYGSGLIAAYPTEFTQTECRQMLELLSGNIIGRLIELGVPAGTRISHKNGWGGTQFGGANVSDAAIVYSPGATYVISVYMWESVANQDGIGSLKPWEAMEGISQLTYNFFNADQPMMVSRIPENPLGAIDCVMPNQNNPERLDLNNISSGRFDESGHILPDACYGYPQCVPAPETPIQGAVTNPDNSQPPSDTTPDQPTAQPSDTGTGDNQPLPTLPAVSPTLPPLPPK
jgi:beta-lactamase class A